MTKKSEEHIELRSDEVQEIMNHVPNWLIQWGVTLIFILFIMLGFIAWFIKYPDIIQGKAIITTEEPPVRLISKVTGDIDSLYLNDKETVKKGEIIATLGTTLSDESKSYLIATILTIETQLKSDQKLNVHFNDANLVFGSIQEPYNELKRSSIEYEIFLETNPLAFEIQNLQDQIQNHKVLESVSYQQLSTAKRELENVQSQYAADQKLFEKKVISKLELFEKEKFLIQAENNVGNYKKAAVQSAIIITDLEKQLNSLLLKSQEQKSEFLERVNSSIASMKNDLNEWENDYQFVSPIDGKLTYLESINKYQNVQSGTALFAIVSKNQDYFGKIDVPRTGLGKVRIGQKVRVSIDKYPEYEFGQLEGEVTNISLLPHEDIYRIEFSLNNGMVSTYGKTLGFSPEMSGTADIITDDVRFMERVFNVFRKIFD